MRFVFTPPADHAAGLLTLPWSEPLAEESDDSPRDSELLKPLADGLLAEGDFAAEQQ